MSFYTFLHYLVNDNSQLTLPYTIFLLSYAFATITYFIIPIYYSEQCVAEIKTTSTLVNKMLNLYEDQSLFKTIAIFSKKILHRDRVISTVFFNIDWTLLFSVIFLKFKSLLSFIKLLHKLSLLSVPEFDFSIFDHHFSIRRRLTCSD
jgi:hypothetical protein